MMIVNKFSALLGARLLKISKISADTGISRTTLTAIYYRKCKAISFDVLTALCKYLNCTITDKIEYIPEEADSHAETQAVKNRYGK